MILPWPNHPRVRAAFFDKKDTAKEKSSFPQVVPIKQVHGKFCKEILNRGEPAEPADACITPLSDISLRILTADCLPLLGFSDDRIGACHAGWKGLHEGVVLEWLKSFPNRESIQIAIGPAIQICHFEVGLDVAEKLLAPYKKAKRGSLSRAHPADPNKLFVNLSAIALEQIESFGVSRFHVQNFSECTYCNEELYFSYRRGKDSGRNESMISFID